MKYEATTTNNKSNGSKKSKNNKKNKPLKNMDVYVVRVRVKDNQTSLSKPCFHCVNTMKLMGVSKVYYSTDGGGWKCEKISEIISYVSSGNRTSNKNK